MISIDWIQNQDASMPFTSPVINFQGFPYYCMQLIFDNPCDFSLEFFKSVYGINFQIGLVYLGGISITEFLFPDTTDANYFYVDYVPNIANGLVNGKVVIKETKSPSW